jgi:hypothetical protein
MPRPHKPSLALLAFVLALPGLRLAAETPLASIDYAEGQFSVTREGRVIKGLDIGDALLDEDYIVTGPTGSLSLALDPSSGMTGLIRVGPRSALSLRLEALPGSTKGQVALAAGQIALKLRKVAGGPGFEVQAEGTVLGVRGTSFSVDASESGNLLVACEEGEVSLDDGGELMSILPGRAAERRRGAGARGFELPAEKLEEKRGAWRKDESEAFRKEAVKAALEIGKEYLDLVDAFRTELQGISANPLLGKWAEEERTGKRSRAELAAIREQLREVGEALRQADRSLLAMRRLGLRVEAMAEALAAEPAILERQLRNGQTLGDFLGRFAEGREKEEQRAATLLRFQKIFKKRLAEFEKPGPNGGAAGKP